MALLKDVKRVRGRSGDEPRVPVLLVKVPAAADRAFEVRHGTTHDLFTAGEDGRWALEAVDSSCAE